MEKPKKILEVKSWGWMAFLPKWLRRWCRNRKEAALAGKGISGKYH